MKYLQKCLKDPDFLAGTGAVLIEQGHIGDSLALELVEIIPHRGARNARFN